MYSLTHTHTYKENDALISCNTMHNTMHGQRKRETQKIKQRDYKCRAG